MRKDKESVKEALEQLTDKLDKAIARGFGFSIEFVVLEVYLLLVAANRFLEISGSELNDKEIISKVLSIYEAFMIDSDCTKSMGNMYFKADIENEYRRLSDQSLL